MNNNFDLEINIQELENLINKFDIYNSKIVDDINLICNTIKNVDRNDWNSKERDVIDNTFIQYLEKSNTLVKENFEYNVTSLKVVLSKYKEIDKKILNEANKLEE